MAGCKVYHSTGNSILGMTDFHWELVKVACPFFHLSCQRMPEAAQEENTFDVQREFPDQNLCPKLQEPEAMTHPLTPKETYDIADAVRSTGLEYIPQEEDPYHFHFRCPCDNEILQADRGSEIKTPLKQRLFALLNKHKKKFATQHSQARQERPAAPLFIFMGEDYKSQEDAMELCNNLGFNSFEELLSNFGPYGVNDMKKTNLIAAKFLASLLGRLSSSVTVAEDSVKSGPIMIDSQYVCHKAALNPVKLGIRSVVTFPPPKLLETACGRADYNNIKTAINEITKIYAHAENIVQGLKIGVRPNAMPHHVWRLQCDLPAIEKLFKVINPRIRIITRLVDDDAAFELYLKSCSCSHEALIGKRLLPEKADKDEFHETCELCDDEDMWDIPATEFKDDMPLIKKVLGRNAKRLNLEDARVGVMMSVIRNHHWKDAEVLVAYKCDGDRYAVRIANSNYCSLAEDTHIDTGIMFLFTYDTKLKGSFCQICFCTDKNARCVKDHREEKTCYNQSRKHRTGIAIAQVLWPEMMENDRKRKQRDSIVREVVRASRRNQEDPFSTILKRLKAAV